MSFLGQGFFMAPPTTFNVAFILFSSKTFCISVKNTAKFSFSSLGIFKLSKGDIDISIIFVVYLKAFLELFVRFLFLSILFVPFQSKTQLHFRFRLDNL